MPWTFWTFLIGVARARRHAAARRVLVQGRAARRRGARSSRRCSRWCSSPPLSPPSTPRGGAADLLRRVPRSRPPARVAAAHDRAAGRARRRDDRRRVPRRAAARGGVRAVGLLRGIPRRSCSSPTIAALSVGAALLGRGRGVPAVPGARAERDPMLRMGPVTTLLQNSYYMDAFYCAGSCCPIRDKVSAAVYWTNQKVLDGAVNGAAALSKGFGTGVKWFDRNVIDGAVNGGGRHGRVHRRAPAVHPVGQRPALRRVPVHRRGGPGHHLHEDLRGDEGRDDLGELGDHDRHVPAGAGGARDRAGAEPERQGGAGARHRVHAAPRSSSRSRSRPTSTTAPVPGLQFELDARWIPAISARYHVGIDGISLPLFVLTFALSFLCAIYSWRFIPSPGKTKGFLALMLLLETGMAGTFIAFDLILFFVFWELVLVPMYFLIGIWGSANREYAAIKFFLYTLFGSVFMLLGFLGMFFRSDIGGGEHTFDIIALQDFAPSGGFSNAFQLVVFAAVGARVRGEGADVAVPHVAPRRPYRGADDRLGAARRDHAEDGDVRVHPDRAADPAVRRREVRAVDRPAGGDRDRVRGARVPRPEGPQTADRVQLGRSHGVRDARDRDAHADRDQRGHLRDGRPRRDHRDAVLLRRVAVRPLPHARDRRDRRRRDAEAAVPRRGVRVRRDRVARAAGPGRVLG